MLHNSCTVHVRRFSMMSKIYSRLVASQSLLYCNARAGIEFHGNETNSNEFFQLGICFATVARCPTHVLYVGFL